MTDWLAWCLQPALLLVYSRAALRLGNIADEYLNVEPQDR
jgi:hypothetical protein